jgi:phosphopantothenoylcysteine decarboxylase/phosphopantothenate--cysteine ligase
MSLIALGVTGGIGAYKAVEVVRGLQNHGHDVVAIMTRSARKFVGPITFEAITGRRVVTGQWTSGANADIEHIAIASDIALLVVAPATANVIGKFANGIADDFLSSLYLATRAPVLMAPAMNTNMLEHAAVQRNLSVLTARGVRFVEPGSGYLACGWIGKGRLAAPEAIVEAAHQLLTASATWQGRRVLVTAGPTYEDLDPVRFIGNRSSGRMGFAIAAEAAARGAVVTLIAGPSRLDAAPGVDVVPVRSASEMHAAVMSRAQDADVIVMAAAVADYTPERVEPEKIVKRDGPMTLSFRRTADILSELGALRASVGRDRPVLVGFAAETEDVLNRARAKRAAKHVDLIVANDVSRADAGFDVDTNEVTIVAADGEHRVPLQKKRDVAAAILDRIDAILRTTGLPAGRTSPV